MLAKFTKSLLLFPLFRTTRKQTIIRKESSVASQEIGPMPEVVYRDVMPDDVQGIRELHMECFPIKYENTFFENVCNGKGFRGIPLYSQVAVEVESSRIVGCILGQFILSDKSDDSGFFSETKRPAKYVFYILTLGLCSDYRRTGLGTELLMLTLKHARKNPDCGAVYLHVIHYNIPAIKFYERNGFTYLRELVEFYHIENIYHSSYLYVLHINGFEPPLLHRFFVRMRKVTRSGLDILINWARSFGSLGTSSNSSSPLAISQSTQVP